MAISAAELKEVRRIAQRAGQPSELRIHVSVALICRAAIEPLAHTGHARGKHRGKGQIGVCVCAGHAVLDPEGTALPHHAEARGAIVQGPRHARRSPRAGLVAFVTVDGRAEAQAQLWRIRDQAAEELAEELRAARSRLLTVYAFTFGGLVRRKT